MTLKERLEKLGNQCGEGRVVITPDTIGGNPRIEGRRISAASLVAQVANYGNVEAVAADYGVSPDDVKSALVFAYKFIDAIFVDDKLQPSWRKQMREKIEKLLEDEFKNYYSLSDDAKRIVDELQRIMKETDE